MGKQVFARLVVVAVVAMLFGTALRGRAQRTAAAPHHVILTPDELKWEPFPAAGPGAQIAIIEADPNKAGSNYVLRLKMPDGGKVPPHWHPRTNTSR